MTDRLPSDHDAVSSHRVHLESVGRTGRPRVPVPAALDLAAGDVVRVSLEGEPGHVEVTEALDGTIVIDAVADNPRLARAGEGADRLREWTDAVGLGTGDPVLVDVLTAGYAYGLRRPGERVVYAAPDAPADSLASIAEDLQE